MAKTQEQKEVLNAIHAMNVQAMQLNKTFAADSKIPKAQYRSDIFNDIKKLQEPTNPDLVNLTKGTGRRGFDPKDVIKHKEEKKSDVISQQPAPEAQPIQPKPTKKPLKIVDASIANDKTPDIIAAADKINSMYKQFSRVLNMLEKKIANGATEVNIKIKFNNEGNSLRQKNIPETLPPTNSQDGGGGSSQAED